MEQISSLELIEVEKEEVELEIKQLENAESNLKELLELSPVGIAREKLSAYLKDLELEIGFSEQRLEEVDNSITFVRERGF